MKKLICTLLLSAAAIFGAIADSAFGGLAKTLNSFDASKAEAIEGKLPDGRDIFPILWKYVYDEPTLPEKTLAFSAKFNSYNLFKNQYVITLTNSDSACRCRNQNSLLFRTDRNLQLQQLQ